MHVLVLGGTMFLGRHIVHAALAAGHQVTIFTRGKTNPDLFAGKVEALRGHRDGDLGALEGRTFDAVIDTCGYVPRVVRQSAELLRDSAHYTFVSTISVYPEDDVFGAGEDAPVAPLEDPNEEQVTGETYGPLKAECENVVREIFGDRSNIVRPGLIVGPFDPTDRFTYWPHRVAEGGEVLAPGDPSREVQIIDARDCAEWIVRAAENSRTGTFNAVTDPFSMGILLATCEAVARKGATFTWVADEFLLAHDVGPWMELPLWVPEQDMISPNTRVCEAGMTFRSLTQTISDTLAWDDLREPGPRGPAGLARDKEEMLLKIWHEA